MYAVTILNKHVSSSSKNLPTNGTLESRGSARKCLRGFRLTIGYTNYEPKTLI